MTARAPLLTTRNGALMARALRACARVPGVHADSSATALLGPSTRVLTCINGRSLMVNVGRRRPRFDAPRDALG
jgi:hypothetical protein